ncbi:hypothetical protein HKCCE4037_04805 [Rhodobacterales bacterium HKCCE4037]|nr:hypothetical protein [Rhodobacterales bacterium HKCCE4037]
MIGTRKSAQDTISELLKAQTSALLSGDFTQLSKIEGPLGRAFDRLRTESASAQVLADIKQRAQRNAVLLQAAQAGVAQAREQIGSRHRATLNVYDATGKTHATRPGDSRLLSRR